MKFLTTLLLIVAVIGIFVNSGLQVTALVELTSLKEETVDADMKTTKNLLLSAIIFGFVAGLLLATSIILLNMYVPEDSSVPYLVLLLAGLTLFTSGVLGGAVALRLQCQRGNKDSPKDKAWQYTSYSSIVGVLGTLLLLFAEGFDKRREIKKNIVRTLGKPVPGNPLIYKAEMYHDNK